jgi:hypothetical protein
MNDENFKDKQNDETKNYLMNIDILLIDNKIKTLKFNHQDNIEEILQNFCKENNISKKVQIGLKQIILEEINRKNNKCNFLF